MTTQKTINETCQMLGITKKYAVGMFNMHWQIVRLHDDAILYEGDCDYDYILAELFRIGIHKNDVAFV